MSYRRLLSHSFATPLALFTLFVLLVCTDSGKRLLKVISPTARAATTFTVNSTNDTSDNNAGDGVCNDGSGNCTLRAALEESNALAGLDTINFSIGSGVSTIVLTADLPMITSPVVIDGTTQPGFAGTPIIEINSNNRSNTNHATLFMSVGSNTIKGLVLNRSSNVAIALAGGADNNHIEGNYIGTDVTGSLRRANDTGIIVNSSNNTIGGTSAATRNVISANFGTGIEFNTGAGLNNVIEGNYIGVNASGTAALSNNSEGIRITGTGNQVGGTNPGAGNLISGNGGAGIEIGGVGPTTVQGNLIGTDVTGTLAIPNERGIRVFNAPNNVIGGTSAAARNVISGNFGAGISIEESNANGNTVQGNFIGVDISGFKPLANTPDGFGIPNSAGGVAISRGNNNLIGGTTAGAPNTIAFNGDAGVRVSTLPNTNIGINNRISRNAIYGNLRLGIDLGANGVTPNDNGDSDTDANKLQNFPIITSVVTASGTTTVNGTLNSAASTTYDLEFFANYGCHPLGNGEGGRFVGAGTVTTDGNGNGTFSIALPSTLPSGQVIAATATDPAGNTSEFSPCSSNAATGLIQFGATTLSVREDLSTLTIPVVRVGGSAGSVTVNYASANNTATAGQDYTAISGSLTFADGEVSKTISLPISSDALVEGSETLFVTLNSPTAPEVIGAMGTVVVRIWDPNFATILEVAPLSVNEGNAGTTNALVKVTLNIAIGKTVTVDYQTFAMTATSGVDFQPVAGSLTFAPGVTSQTVSVPIVGDTLDEADETFRIGLSNAVNAVVSFSSDPATVLIVDDDPPPGISVNDVGVIEGTSGTTDAVFTINLSAPSSRQISVNYATGDGSATAGADYQSTSGTVVFNAGDVSKPVTVVVNGDMVAEPLETFFLNLTTPINATIVDSQGVGTIGDNTFAGVKFGATSYNALESDHFIQIGVTRTGDTTGTLSIDYNTADVTASQRSDYTPVFGTLVFNAGETNKTLTVLVNEDAFQEGNEIVNLRLANPTGGSFISGPSTVPLTIVDTTSSSNNPIDDAAFFVRQHYHDFLNREPDAGGLAFWTNQITECQQPGATCNAEVRRINVSAAFFLSIEFQETGYLVERLYKSAYGDATATSNFGPTHQLAVPIVRLQEFLPDTQQVSNGVIIGQPGADQKLEQNKVAFTQAFVTRSRFTTAYATSLTPAQFVDALFANAGVTPSASDRAAAINEFGGAANTADTNARARALRLVAENSILNQQEKNRAFVLMQYFGYLRRNPNDPQDSDYSGYDFWLTKLNQFDGNFINAEMVKAFIISGEYRQRFGFN